MSIALKYGDCCKEKCLRVQRYVHQGSGQARYFEYCINKGCGYKSKAWYYKQGESFPTVIGVEP